MDQLLVFPLLIPMLTASFMIAAYKSRLWQRRLNVLGTMALLIVALGVLSRSSQGEILTLNLGDWPAPFGITFVADLFSSIMLVMAALIGFAVALYSLASMDAARERFGYYPLYQFLLMGVGGAFLTGDLFNLYVWFEVMLMASFALMALGGEREQMEGAIKYVTLNLLSSALFLAALGLLYGLIGSLNMADVALKIIQLQISAHQTVLTTISMLFLAAFGIKAAIFPLFFWLPDSYHTPPPAVSSVFSGLLSKVGVYALIRVFTLIFLQDTAYTHSLILVVAGITMVTGVLGAVVQNQFRRILSFHMVSQIGYMIMGLGMLTPMGLAGSVFYLMQYIVVKPNLFLVSGVVERLKGSGELKLLGGLYRARPGLAALFLIPALSLAGLPPLSGFFAKYSLVYASVQVGQYAIAAAALGVSLLTLYSMIKIWNEVFWKAEPERETSIPQQTEVINRQNIDLLQVPIILLAGVSIAFGVGVGFAFRLALLAGEQLANPAEYIRAVLGGI